jgi:hypothetical protein
VGYSWTVGGRLCSKGYKTARSCSVVTRVRFVPSGVSRGGSAKVGGVFLWHLWPSVMTREDNGSLLVCFFSRFFLINRAMYDFYTRFFL